MINTLFPTINSVYVFASSIMLGAICGILGCFTVLRRQGLLADTLAHSALPGVAIAFIIMQQKFLPGLLLGALISALLGAAFINFLTTNSKIKTDTAMAATLSVFFGAGVLLLTYIQKLPLSAQAGLETFLFGQAASILRTDMILIAGVFLFSILICIIFWKEFKIFIFDPNYAHILGLNRVLFEILFNSLLVFSILMSLQTVGVVLTAALFITPAAAALIWSQRLGVNVILSVLFGIIAGGSGAILSSLAVHLPTGPVIVVLASLIFGISFIIAPTQGLISKIFRFRRHSRKIRIENALARLYRDLEKDQKAWTKEQFHNLTSDQAILSTLKKSNFTKTLGNSITLTIKGKKYAAAVVSKHRLWETFLARKMKLPSDQLHRDAELVEHLLDQEMAAELRSNLNNPKLDPHQSPIPKLPKS